MELIHVIRGIDAVCRAEGAEQLDRMLHIDNADFLIAVKAELAARKRHHEGVPLAVLRMAKDSRFKILIEGIIGGGAVRIKAVFKKILFCHNLSPFAVFRYRYRLSFSPIIPHRVEKSSIIAQEKSRDCPAQLAVTLLNIYFFANLLQKHGKSVTIFLLFNVCALASAKITTVAYCMPQKKEKLL